MILRVRCTHLYMRSRHRADLATSSVNAGGSGLILRLWTIIIGQRCCG